MTRRPVHRPREPRRVHGLVALVIFLALAGLAFAFAWTGTRDSPPPGTVATTAPPVFTLPGCPLGAGRCPDPKVTPGQVDPQATSIEHVCVAGADGRDTRRRLTARQEREVLAAYHLPATTRVLEWDHLQPYWAGGMSTPQNVWPMTNQADKSRKDALERLWYEDLCVRHLPGLTLTDVQQRSLEFWSWWA